MFFKFNLVSRILVPVIGITVLFSICLFLLGNFLVQDMIRTSFEAARDSKISDIYSNIDRVSSKVLSQAALFSRADAVQEAYRIAHSGDITDENDPKLSEARNMLRKSLASMEEGYAAVLKGGNFRIHFHLPPARSLLRLWKHDQNTSDDLQSFRDSILTIGKGDHAPVRGIEIGRGGFAIRGIAPVFSDDDTYLGSVEVLSTFDPVVRYSVSNKTEFIAVYMNKEFLPIATRLKDPKKHPVIGTDFVFVSATDPGLADSVVTPDLLTSGKSGVHTARVGNYMSTALPIKSFSGDQIGVLVYINDASTSFNSLADIRLGVAVLCVLLLIVICIPLFLIVKKARNSIGAEPEDMVFIANSIADGDLNVSMDKVADVGASTVYGALHRMAENLQNKGKLADAIAAGDLTAEVTLDSDRDVLGRAFERMVRSLTEIISRVQEASEQVESGSNQIAGSSQSLSNGATVQAASVEEISSSMTQMAAQTQKNAQNSSLANEMVIGVKTTAENGDEQMQKMIGAMHEINASSGEIAKIIKTIDDIAFQTNLLALNAAVEAARAGRHGKGFAVVAQEVRNLAGRSAKAARVTAELIKESVIKVENGATIADETAQALRDIVDGVAKVTDLMGEITISSNEQAQGITQINQGLSQVEEITQDNTANAEQTAAAAEELTHQANTLQQILTRFKLNNADDESQEADSRPVAHVPQWQQGGLPPVALLRRSR